MLCMDNDKGFIISPYYREVYYTKMSRKHRFYFKHGILEVRKKSISENHIMCCLYYKDRYLASWTDIDDRITVRSLIAAVCRTLDIALGVD